MKDLDDWQIHQLNKNAWENVVDEFAEYREEVKITDTFIKFISLLNEGDKILDLGCGTGIPFTRYMYEKKMYIKAIDFSSNMIDIARKNLPAVEFVVQSMEDITEVSHFNGIVSSYSMQLLHPDIFKKVVQLSSRAAIDGGYMYISLNETTENSNPYVTFMNAPMYFKDYSEKDLLNIFTQHGFEPIHVHKTIETSDTFGDEQMMEIIFKKLR